MPRDVTQSDKPKPLFSVAGYYRLRNYNISIYPYLQKGMRFDAKVGQLGLGARQRFFFELWLNMVHERSIDAFRVRAMNPLNSLQEMLKVTAPGSPANASDVRRIFIEANYVLSSSPVLATGKFEPAREELAQVLTEALAKQKDGKDAAMNASFPLVEAYGRELVEILRGKFVEESISWLRDALTPPSPAPAAGSGHQLDPEFARIDLVVGHLLSSLVGDGWSLESLFSLARATTLNGATDPAGSPFDFVEAVDWMFDRITREPTPYKVIFSISQVSKTTEIPGRVGDITFSKNPPDLGPNSNEQSKRYAHASGAKLFATMVVEAKDGRIAGMQAATHIEQVLDIVRYDFERNNLVLSDTFLVEKDDRHMLLELARTVPNPALEGASTLQQFMQQLQDLVTSGALESDSKERIYSAFRLYRTGAESKNLENKLVNWWTALEFFIKAGGQGGIGDAVENALTPVVVVDYLAKHLAAVLSALNSMKAELREKPDSDPIALKDLPLQAFYKMCKDKTWQNLILTALSASPYVQYQTDAFFRKINNPKDVAAALTRHEQNVRWQIQRIYRARCDIVHSAGRIAQPILLCANLESYLKLLLDTFLRSLHQHATLRTPKEFFDRKRHSLSRLIADLSAGKDDYLINILPSR